MLALILLIATAGRHAARNYYVSPRGEKKATGTRTHPMAFHNLLYGDDTLTAGDTVFLKKGIYIDSFVMHWSGALGKPIVIRSLPGENAILEGNIRFRPGCNYLTLMDFEITNDVPAHPQRVSMQKGSGPKDIYTCEGMTIGFTWMNGIKLINLVIHDNIGDGISIWTRATNSEIYGCIIYNNGWDGPDRGHGHGIYTQNDTGLKVIADNICFGNIGSCGIKAYSEGGSVKNFRFEGNVILNLNEFLVGGFQPMENITFLNNYMGDSAWTHLGYHSKPNHNLVAQGNYFHKLFVNDWETIRFEHNKVIGWTDIEPKDSTPDSGYHLDYNEYFPCAEVGFRKKKTNLEGLRLKGFEKNGTYYNELPHQPDVFVRPNKYEAGRAHIIIYNWQGADSVSVSLDSVLHIGDQFEIRDVQNFKGPPAYTGTFKGAPLLLPMTLTDIAPLLGDVSEAHHPRYMPRVHSPKTFATFVVRKANRTNH